MKKLIDKKDAIKEQKEENIDVQIGCILHDIGKFHQRADKRHFHTAHEKLSKTFVKNIGFEETENMVLYHMGKNYPSSLSEKDKFLTNIVSKADVYSCKEREDLGHVAENVRKEPLISIFSNCHILYNEKKEYYFPLGMLDLKNLTIPVESKKEAIGELNHNDYGNLWKEFLKDSKIQNKNFGTIYHMLKKYTLFMPSAAFVSYPDISLFDHSKTTAAIGSCMHLYLAEKGERTINDKTKYFNMISGDISGIQNFIYGVSSPQFARIGMAKRLRGRSFYTNLLSENLARIIIDRLELTDANILWCGGGHFLIVAPNTNRAKNILDDYETEIGKFLFSKYGDKLFLSLTYQDVSGKELDNFAFLKENMVYSSARKNRQKYLNDLDMVFKEEESIPENICKICGSISRGDICNECNTHGNLGDKITRADFIVRVVTKDDSARSDFDIFELNVGYFIVKKENLLEKIERVHKSSLKIHISKLNDTNFLDIDIIRKLEERGIQASFGFSFLGNTVPYHDKYGAFDFEHIAKISRGTKKLGVFKVNVDNVEKLFETGLSNTSISRISTMSSLLDIFISGYVNEMMKEYYILPEVCSECREKVDSIDLTFSEDTIKVYREKEEDGKIKKVCNKCAEKKIPMLYTGHSGGDELLIIGPWDIIVKFSKDIRDRFKKYTCNNKDISISAGIFMCNSKFPIDRAVHIVDEILKKSKTLGKDRLSIFSETITWEPFGRFKGYDELLEFANILESLAEKKMISRGLVYSLRSLLRQEFGDLQESDFEYKMIARIEKRRYEHKLKYSLARNVKDDNIREELNKKLIIDRLFPWIEIPVSIAIYKWRQK